ncbi:hypothetical protein IAR50_005917 [Cryptococcus sp. DSM 104548]
MSGQYDISAATGVNGGGVIPDNIATWRLQQQPVPAQPSPHVLPQRSIDAQALYQTPYTFYQQPASQQAQGVPSNYVPGPYVAGSFPPQSVNNSPSPFIKTPPIICHSQGLGPELPDVMSSPEQLPAPHSQLHRDPLPQLSLPQNTAPSSSISPPRKETPQPTISASTSVSAGQKRLGNNSLSPRSITGVKKQKTAGGIIDSSRESSVSSPSVKTEGKPQKAASGTFQATLDGYLSAAGQAKSGPANLVASGAVSNSSAAPGSNHSVSVKAEPQDAVCEKPTVAVDMSVVRRAITPEALKRDAPGALFKHLRVKHDKENDKDLPPAFTPNPDQLKEILTQLKDHASHLYLKKMADSDYYVEVWEGWLKAARKDPVRWEKVLALLLEVLARTEIEYEVAEYFRIPKLAKLLMAAVEQNKLGSAKAIAEAYSKFQPHMLAMFKRSAASKDKGKTEATGTKRKVDVGKDGVKVKEEPASKRPATAATPSSKLASNPAASSTVSDMSFFSVTPSLAPTVKPKPKPKPVPPKAAPAPAVKPQGASLLANVMSSFTKQGAAPEYTTDVKKEVKETRRTKSGRVIGTVTWKNDAELREIREFTPDPVDRSSAPKESAHDMDMAEGKLLARNRDRDDIEWSEPIPYIEGEFQPVETDETRAQREREHGALAVPYFEGQIPADLAEDGVRIVLPFDNATRQMTAAPIYGAVPAYPPPPDQNQIQALLANLNIPTNLNIPIPIPQPSVQNHYAAAQQHYPGQEAWANASAGPSMYGSEYGGDSGAEWRKGSKKKKGPWKPEKQFTKTCHHWRRGNCPFGDRCNYAHHE